MSFRWVCPFVILFCVLQQANALHLSDPDSDLLASEQAEQAHMKTMDGPLHSRHNDKWDTHVSDNAKRIMDFVHSAAENKNLHEVDEEWHDITNLVTFIQATVKQVSTGEGQLKLLSAMKNQNDDKELPFDGLLKDDGLPARMFDLADADNSKGLTRNELFGFLAATCDVLAITPYHRIPSSSSTMDYNGMTTCGGVVQEVYLHGMNFEVQEDEPDKRKEITSCCDTFCERNDCWCGTWGCDTIIGNSDNFLPDAWTLRGCCAIVNNRRWPAECSNPNANPEYSNMGWHNEECTD